MKYFIVFFFLVVVSFQSCMTISNLPADLPKSKLLVEKVRLNTAADYDKPVTNEKIQRDNRYAIKFNTKMTKVFSKYRFDYQFVLPDEVEAFAKSTGTVYYLKDGGTVQVATFHDGKTGYREKTNVELVNLKKNQKKVIGSFKSGIYFLAPKFVKKANKLQGGSTTKKK